MYDNGNGLNFPFTDSSYHGLHFTFFIDNLLVPFIRFKSFDEYTVSKWVHDGLFFEFSHHWLLWY